MSEANIQESLQSGVTFEEFCDEWLLEFTGGDLSSVEKGERFAIKLVTEWLDVTDDDDNLIVCGGPGDGGIDVAYLSRPELDESDQNSNAAEGSTWYLIQSKYGTAFQGADTILAEGRKVLETLAGHNDNLNERSKELVDRLNNFRLSADSQRDRIVLVFATVRQISGSDRTALNDLRAMGVNRLPHLFDVQDISLHTIWEPPLPPAGNEFPLKLESVTPSDEVRVGVTRLTDLYQFLKIFRDKTGDMDQLYAKNVRRFLGKRGRVNTAIERTLLNEPQMFGLYNNGITIAVSGFSAAPDGVLVLRDPYVVNGCQTTKTIWNVMVSILEAGGTGQSESLNQWRSLAENGVVVTKVVEGNDQQIQAITRFTNFQNAVGARDFLALDEMFKPWAEDLAAHGVFLEIQKGGWDSQRAYQKSHPSAHQFQNYAKALDLLKVIGAGWMQEPGLAFNKNEPFLPDSTVFDSILQRAVDEPQFGPDDLRAAYRLKAAADNLGFGRRAVQTRRQTRFLFYFVVMSMLRYILSAKQKPTKAVALTQAVLTLAEDENVETFQKLSASGALTVDNYLNAEMQFCAHNEVAYRERFNRDMNGFLKWDKLGKPESTPHLTQLLTLRGMLVMESHTSEPSLADAIDATLGN